MKVELLVSEWCASCHQAEKIWREVAQEREFEFAVLDMGQPEGRALVSRLRLKTIPALVIDNELKGIGVQSVAEARALVQAAPPKVKSDMQHTGLSLSQDNRWFVLASLIYLMLAGLGLVINGALLSDGPMRPLALHLFTVGFCIELGLCHGRAHAAAFYRQPDIERRLALAADGSGARWSIGLQCGIFIRLARLGVGRWRADLVFSTDLYPAHMAGALAQVSAGSNGVGMVTSNHFGITLALLIGAQVFIKHHADIANQ